MSLKAFHFVFIALAFALSVLCAVWSFANQASDAFGIGSVAAAVLLAAYGVWFIKKSRNIET